MLVQVENSLLFSKNPCHLNRLLISVPQLRSKISRLGSSFYLNTLLSPGVSIIQNLWKKKSIWRSRNKEILEAEEKARKIRSEKARKKAMSPVGRQLRKEMPQHVLQHKTKMLRHMHQHMLQHQLQMIHTVQHKTNATACCCTHTTSTDESMLTAYASINATACCGICTSTCYSIQQMKVCYSICHSIKRKCYSICYGICTSNATASADESMLQHMPQHKTKMLQHMLRHMHQHMLQASSR